MVVHLKRIDYEEHLADAFHHFDKNGNGFIEFEELEEAFHDDFGANNEQVIRDIMREVDSDKVKILKNP